MFDYPGAFLKLRKERAYRKFVQMVSYCPYFISTIVFVGIINMIFDNRSGVIGSFFFNNLGINILGNASYFRPCMFGQVSGRVSALGQSSTWRLWQEWIRNSTRRP